MTDMQPGDAIAKHMALPLDTGTATTVGAHLVDVDEDEVGCPTTVRASTPVAGSSAYRTATTWAVHCGLGRNFSRGDRP